MMQIDAQALEIAMQDDPQLAAVTLLHLLTGAASRCDLPQLMPDVLMATMISARALLQLSSSSAERALEQVASITGLPDLLAACVAHCTLPTGAGQQQAKISFPISYLRLLERLLDHAPASQQLTPQQLERMHLPRLLRQQQLHGASPEESSDRAYLHAMCLLAVRRVAEVHSDSKPLVTYWREAGVGQLKVSKADTMGWGCPTCCLPATCWLGCVHGAGKQAAASVAALVAGEAC